MSQPAVFLVTKILKLSYGVCLDLKRIFHYRTEKLDELISSNQLV